MKIIRTPKEMQSLSLRLHRQGKTIGFVPTMGALHEGHLSLILSARKESDIVVVSIFVNPLQFGPKEDLKKYPRPIALDKRLLQKAKVDYLFYPTVSAMYPPHKVPRPLCGGGGRGKGEGKAKKKKDADIMRQLCGKSRPGHFEGVKTVVAKLFSLVQPSAAYFGQKDYQQSVILRRLVTDLGLSIRMKVLPIIRDEDGLALSSRNRYLTPSDRERARTLSRTLYWIRDRVLGGERNLRKLKSDARRGLDRTLDRVDYFEIVDPETLVSLKRFQPRMVALTACFLGKTRLIDNVIIRTH